MTNKSGTPIRTRACASGVGIVLRVFYKVILKFILSSFVLNTEAILH